ncbi:Rho-binding antiterminator [Planctobacterium marinum]|uniref:Rho-specific inhibitor of transcription termination (YaeO) n=1 Tax=Planctobacterium marinum TaxID=1631968 RepID=A0AA48HMI4_9ALTE|nr:hypothetical protein MACH26_30470 [Planctobacterium marinum]
MLSCDLHDYLEIICMFHYEVSITLKNDTDIDGKALDVGLNAERQEVLTLESKSGIEAVLVEQIKLIEVLTPGARFKQVSLV